MTKTKLEGLLDKCDISTIENLLFLLKKMKDRATLHYIEKALLHIQSFFPHKIQRVLLYIQNVFFHYSYKAFYRFKTFCFHYNHNMQKHFYIFRTFFSLHRESAYIHSKRFFHYIYKAVLYIQKVFATT